MRPQALSPLIASVFVTVLASGMALGDEERPNVLVILADDLGYADVGMHGAPDIATPNIDRLASSGVRMTSGYAAHAFCSPMRASLMTGRYQHRFGYERNIAYDPHNRRMGLPRSEKTVATRLRKAGYATGVVGKWHLGAARPFHPRHRGFDFFYGFLGGGHDYFSVDLLRPMGEGYFQPLERDGKPEVLEGYLTGALSEAAVRFIESRRDEPFFLYVAYNAPHTPMQAPEEYLERYTAKDGGDGKKKSPTKREIYAAMVSAMDDGIGEILDVLERRGIRGRTAVFFLSDNGGPERANASRNDPLRGEKGDLWEGGIRVPFVVSWPGVLPAGSEYHHPVISHDISSTALALAGVDVAADPRLDGVDLVPYLRGERGGAPHDALFWRKEGGEEWAVRSGRWKLVKISASGKPELYDLDADLAETSDLAEEKPSEVARLAELREEWDRGNEPPFFPGFREYHRIMDRHYRSVSGRGGGDGE